MMIDPRRSARKCAAVGVAAMLAGALTLSAGSASAYVIGGTDYVESGPSEGLGAVFTTADGGITTNSYSNFVRLLVTGTGESSSTRLNDAFYIFTDTSHAPTAPFNDASYYQLTVGTATLVPFMPSQDAKHIIRYDIDAGTEVTPTYVPAYRAGHDYDVIVDVGALSTMLHFGVSDGIFSDNSGTYRIGVWQLAAVPEPAALAVFTVGLAGLGALRRRRRS